jgi:hypothetical protein
MFGPEELKHVGGERWWQARGLTGVDAEWIAEQAHVSPDAEFKNRGGNLSAEDLNILHMEKLDTGMVLFNFSPPYVLWRFLFYFFVAAIRSWR